MIVSFCRGFNFQNGHFFVELNLKIINEEQLTRSVDKDNDGGWHFEKNI